MEIILSIRSNGGFEIFIFPTRKKSDLKFNPLRPEGGEAPLARMENRRTMRMRDQSWIVVLKLSRSGNSEERRLPQWEPASDETNYFEQNGRSGMIAQMLSHMAASPIGQAPGAGPPEEVAPTL